MQRLIVLALWTPLPNSVCPANGARKAPRPQTSHDHLTIATYGFSSARYNTHLLDREPRSSRTLSTEPVSERDCDAFGVVGDVAREHNTYVIITVPSPRPPRPSRGQPPRGVPGRARRLGRSRVGGSRRAGRRFSPFYFGRPQKPRLKIILRFREGRAPSRR